MTGPTSNSTPSVDVHRPWWQEHKEKIQVVAFYITSITSIAGLVYLIVITSCKDIEKTNEESQQVTGSPNNTTTDKSVFKKHQCTILPIVITFALTVLLLLILTCCCIRRGYKKIESVTLSYCCCCCNQGKARDDANEDEQLPLNRPNGHRDENIELTTPSGRNANEVIITNSSQTDINPDNLNVPTEAIDSQEDNLNVPTEAINSQEDNQNVPTEAVDSQEEGSRIERIISSESQPIIENENGHGKMAISGSLQEGGEGVMLDNVNSRNVNGTIMAASGSSHQGGEGDTHVNLNSRNVNGTIMAASGSSHQGGEGDTHVNLNSQNVNETSTQEGEGDNDSVESRFTYDFFIISDNKTWEKNTLKKLEEKKKRNGKYMKGFYDKRDILPGKIRQTAAIAGLRKSKTCVIGYMKKDMTDNPLYIAVMQQEDILKQKEYRKGRLIPVKIEEDSVVPEEIGNAVQAFDGWESDAVDILYRAIESID